MRKTLITIILSLFLFMGISLSAHAQTLSGVYAGQTTGPVGQNCSTNPSNDNHITLSGLKTTTTVTQIVITSTNGNGDKWVLPCNSVNWIISIMQSGGNADLYFAVSQMDPGYNVTITYADTTTASTTVSTTGTPTPTPTPSCNLACSGVQPTGSCAANCSVSAPAFITVASTPTPTSTPPIPTPTPTPATLTYYIDNSPSANCSDSNLGTTTSAPWCTVSKAQSILTSLTSDQQVLFKCGDIWNEELDVSGVHGTAGHPIIIGHYGINCVPPSGTYSATLPVLNGGSTRQYGINGISGSNSYLVIDGFEVHDTTKAGILFNASPACGGDPGIVIKNNLIHQVGPGAYTGGGTPFDDNDYGHNAALGFEDACATGGNDGVQILTNTVWDVGGHNTLRVHYDSSPNTLVQGNTVGPGCLHNCIDTKGINGTVEGNITTCPTSTARGNQCLVTPNADAGFYTENTNITAGVSATWLYNIAYNVPLCYQATATSTTPSSPKYYNNDCYNPARYYLYLQVCTSADVRKNIFSGSSTSTFATACVTRWDYNDEFGTTGSPFGTNDLLVDPQYTAPTATPPNFHTNNASVNTHGAGDTVTPSAFLGAVGP